MSNKARDANIVWQLFLELRAESLRSTDPVPLILSQIDGFIGTQSHRSALHTIFTELFANAMEHGLLRLDSQLKKNPESFVKYYEKRDEGLKALIDGFIRFKIVQYREDRGNYLHIEVEDSGPGYDFEKKIQSTSDGVLNKGYFGRGLLLLKSLCRDAQIHAPGNRIEITYELDPPLESAVGTQSR